MDESGGGPTPFLSPKAASGPKPPPKSLLSDAERKELRKQFPKQADEIEKRMEQEAEEKEDAREEEPTRHKLAPTARNLKRMAAPFAKWGGGDAGVKSGGAGEGDEKDKENEEDELLDEVKETNKLLKDLIDAVKEKPGNPKRQDDSPDDASPDDGGEDFDEFQKSVNQMIDGGKAAQGTAEGAAGEGFMDSLIETAVELGALAAG
jgi:hypothetical protein